MRLRYAILASALAVGAALAAPAAATAQVPTLDRVDSLVTAGSYDDARRILDANPNIVGDTRSHGGVHEDRTAALEA